MKIPKCPICGRTPLVISLAYTSGHKDHSISCNGPADSQHPPVRSGVRGMKGAAVASWAAIVKDVQTAMQPLSAEDAPQVKHSAVACPAGTPDVQTGHEVRPRLGCEKGSGAKEVQP